MKRSPSRSSEGTCRVVHRKAVVRPPTAARPPAVDGSLRPGPCRPATGLDPALEPCPSTGRGEASSCPSALTQTPDRGTNRPACLSSVRSQPRAPDAQRAPAAPENDARRVLTRGTPLKPAVAAARLVLSGGPSCRTDPPPRSREPAWSEPTTALAGRWPTPGRPHPDPSDCFPATRARPQARHPPRRPLPCRGPTRPAGALEREQRRQAARTCCPPRRRPTRPRPGRAPSPPSPTAVVRPCLAGHRLGLPPPRAGRPGLAATWRPGAQAAPRSAETQGQRPGPPTRVAASRLTTPP